MEPDIRNQHPLYREKHLDPRIGREGQIRTVTLHAGEDSSPVSCTLKVLTLDYVVSYNTSFDALSYRWGPVYPSFKILLDGHEFEVGENLWQALNHLRYPGEDRTLWIDAICIDQNNNIERARQVKMMGKIYQRAREVLVWLGPKSELSLGVKIKDRPSIYFPAGGPYSTFRGSTAAQDAAVERLCGNQYWTRIWIIQEIIFALRVTIHFGTQMINWYDFLNIARKKYWTDSKGIPIMLGDFKTQHENSNPQGLKMWLQLFRFSECQLPHDIVYGFLGFLSPGSRQRIDVDYKKPLEALVSQVMWAEKADSPKYNTSELEFILRHRLGLPANPNNPTKPNKYVASGQVIGLYREGGR